MEKKVYVLRAHHAYNLAAGFPDYVQLEEGLRTAMTGSNGDRRRAYTDDDVRSTTEFYKEIASNTGNVVKIRRGIDQRCVQCSNYQGEQCTLFTQDELALQDARDKGLFRKLGIGKNVTVSDILGAREKLRDLSLSVALDAEY
jgi:hypothetical protein